ncbi:MAG: DUF192 domain-containing protein [Fimbriimonadaceae bacterium]|nr:DUF192 domain-containing protein [Chitinophagales bacterium]
MKKRIISTTAVFITLIIISGSFGCNKPEPDNSNPSSKNHSVKETPQFKKEGELTFFKADGNMVIKIYIEIAETEAEQEKGLMNRPWMDEKQGMLFIFNIERQQAFWMRNTIIPLDIIYVNSKKEIVSIAKDAQPFSEKSLPSAKPAQYVIEVIAGFTEKYNITAGDKVDWQKM